MIDGRPLAVFARLGSRPIPRVVRMARVAAELGYEPLFCGALREEGLPRRDRWQDLPVLRLGRHFPLLNARHPWIYVRSVARYNFDLFRFLRRESPALLHASDIETMPACTLYRLFKGTRLVYNIHDNVAQRYEVGAVIRAFLNFAEGVCVRLADATVVPEEFRRDALPAWCRSKVSVVRNTPGDIPFAPPRTPVDGRIRMFFGGWLDWGRGLRSLMDLAVANPRIELRVAGEGSEAIVRELIQHPAVTYLGFLDHDSVLEETRQCHVVAALYDPARTINRYAASNKLAEAIAIGRPLLLNSETEASRMFASEACAIVVPYAEVDRAWRRLETLIGDWPAYVRACEAARRLFDEHYAWHPVRQAIVEAIRPTSGSSP